MQLRDFQRQCGAMLQAFGECADPVFAERIATARRRLASERLKILVIGRFSRGKSTFINALIGEPVLPSCALPTTATISLLRGGAQRSAVVTYHDGHQEWLDLPKARTYRYLDYVVTSKNGRARTIRQVHLSLPGRLEQIQADLVDTPGVHELDELREDILFRYLREADAVVVLLDPQEPLSSSERSFLRECVPENGLSRMLFVINKVDELEDADPYEREWLAGLALHVGTQLSELTGTAAPEVFPVSALKVLQARNMGVPSPWLTGFEAFERRLLAFATSQALAGRLQGHCRRLREWIAEQQRLLEICVSALEGTAATSERLEQLRAEQSALQGQLEGMQQRWAGFEERMRSMVGELWGIEVERLRLRLVAALFEATPERLDGFGAELCRELRRLIARFENGAEGLRAEGARDVGDVLVALGSDGSEPLMDDLLGLLADFFLPGWWTVRSVDAGPSAPRAAPDRARLREAAEERCDQLQARGAALSDRIARRYAEALRAGMQRCAGRYGLELSTAIDVLQAVQSQPDEARSQRLTETRHRLTRLRALQVACEGLRGRDSGPWAAEFSGGWRPFASLG